MNLSVSDDGAVPIHHHVYPGNRNDETTHMETWDALCGIHGTPNFLYVADCKLCTQEQLQHIIENRAKAITILPHHLVEVRRFYDQLRAGPIARSLLWRRPKPNYPQTTESFYLYEHPVSYSLHWSRKSAALAAEVRTDGVVPLLCTDPSVLPKAVLQACKFQARLEKRFAQFKDVHRAAPLLFKKIERVEANMFVFFIALLIQALLERELRQQLAERGLPPLKLYPEERHAPHPTTAQLFKTFDRLSTYAITQAGIPCETYHDELSTTHRQVLSLLNISEPEFWS